MPSILLTGKADRRTTAIIYEPRQTMEQEEVELDRVDLEPGETREYELRSATAGFRLEDNPAPVPEDFFDPAPDQPPGPAGVPADTELETQAGKEQLANVPAGAETDPVRIARSPERRAAEVPPRVERSERRSVPEGERESREDRAQRLTAGQDPATADNPSAATGTTGQAKADKEQAASTQSPSEEQLAANKASDAATPPTQAADDDFEPDEPEPKKTRRKK